MAINPSTEYPGQTGAPDAGHPYGDAKNESAPGVFDGTPFEKAYLSDDFGLKQALLFFANIVPSGTADTAADKNSSQYLQAILHQVVAGYVFEDSGAADAYVLDVVSNNPAPADYEDNATYVYKAGNSNTGASTVNIESLGVKSIVLKGVALTAGAIPADEWITIRFDLANNRFELVVFGAPAIAQTKAWINLNGTGTIAINQSFNVLSIDDNGTGNYDINLDTNFANTTYGWIGTARDNDDSLFDNYVSAGASDTKTVGALQIRVVNSGGGASDSPDITVEFKGAQ